MPPGANLLYLENQIYSYNPATDNSDWSEAGCNPTVHRYTERDKYNIMLRPHFYLWQRIERIG